MKANCLECGTEGNIAEHTEPEDFILCDECGTVAVWTGAALRELTGPEAIELMGSYPVSPPN